MRVLHFTVPGAPRPKLRARSGVIKRKGTDGMRREDYRSITYNAKSNEDEEARIWPHCRKAMHERRIERATGAVALYVIAVFLLPKLLSRKERMARLWHIQKPDKDNVEKIVADALKGVAWEDDCQVTIGGQFKVWSTTQEGYEVWIAHLPPSPLEVRGTFACLRAVNAQFLDRVEHLTLAGRCLDDDRTLPLVGA